MEFTAYTPLIYLAGIAAISIISLYAYKAFK